MSQLLRTLRFFTVFLKQRYSQIEINQSRLIDKNGYTLTFDDYNPKKKCIGTIVFTHGMTRKANQDERIRSFGKAMATIGYRMLVPLYPHIQKLDVTVESINDIKQSLMCFIEHGYTSNDKLSIFSVSFSGAQALRAISDPAIAPHICSFLALGTANSYISTFKKILEPNNNADCYVKLLLLHNLLLHSEKEYPDELHNTIQHAIDDAYDNNDIQTLSQHGEILTKDLQEQYLNLLEKLFKTDQIFIEHRDTIEEIEQKFINSGDLTQLKTPICLIHSENDQVLMPCESEALYTILSENNIPCSLTITPLLDHVDTNFSMKQIKQAWQLLKGFNFFFKHAKTKNVRKVSNSR